MRQNWAATGVKAGLAVEQARRVNFQGIASVRHGLPAAMADAAAGLASGPESARLAALCDSRDLHRTVFAPLLPESLRGLAGTWRGTPGTAAESVARAVFVARKAPGLRNRDMCMPPDQVAGEMERLAARLTAIWDAAPPPPDTAYAQLAEFTRDFFAIHPFVDGNGHVYRLLAPVLAARLGLSARADWTPHPRPYDHVMSLCLQWYPHHPDLLACYLRRWFDPARR